MASRMGKEYMIHNGLLTMRFVLPRKEGSLWLLDGSSFLFAYKDENAEIKTLIIYVVLD